MIHPALTHLHLPLPLLALGKQMDQVTQELVDHIIGFLHDSPRDWPACALVSRSWVYAAQAHIFRRVSLKIEESTDEHLGNRFLATLEKSPHLIRHVRQLQVMRAGRLSTRSTDPFPAICHFPFTHLDRVDVTLSLSEASCILGLQQLLSLPTIRRAKIACHFVDPSHFAQIWDRCSPRLAHLAIFYSQSPKDFPPSQSPPSYIRLQSLDFGEMMASAGLRDWLTHPLCPFDFSRIKHLAVATSTELIVSYKLEPGLKTIETLDVHIERIRPPLNLSLLPRLALLRFHGCWQAWPWVYTTLSTITSRSRIIKIIFVGGFHGTTPEEFDLFISNLPISPIVELQMATNAITPNLPRLTSANLLRRVKYDQYFFQRITGMQ
ncbi:hypothetical protein C8R44DRAFT_791639 [Mycena epipterygia]|nr:hypothetical protein C8R44DRAFT_791639 [Mycena epipterygia]